MDYLINNKEELERRGDGFSMLIDYDGKITFDYGSFEENKQKLEALYLKQQHVTKEISEIKGQTACAGQAKGRVRIIKDISKIQDFSKGDILVTGMTRPEFVPIMEKAAAIVTDEGGVTCHAAIVSRELGVPCVVGTNVATKVLKEGDLVEVNATEGVVKIIKGG